MCSEIGTAVTGGIPPHPPRNPIPPVQIVGILTEVLRQLTRCIPTYMCVSRLHVEVDDTRSFAVLCDV